MEALLVIDVQNGIVEHGEFQEELAKIEKMILHFKEKGKPVIFMRHLDSVEESPLYEGSRGSELHESVKGYAEQVIEKRTPSSFYQTNLAELLDDYGVNQVYITGFMTEFCCLFTTIAAFDRGYQVTLIEDATGTTNNGETYEMADLNIRDFVGTVLHWSEVVDVVDFEELELP
ncbi:cysteine hydrolase family protein [Sporosarcina sp. Te-1]|uniref:cysteine hydrolase family protein n=1 Tax=Sporosarcina sp. Te-1 TaxID=2818390 RepID=UPI001A9ED491|nr:cysteine hydrolase family protein [Sporosarcina sp. Te-1]QTD40491.1 cysteine hydrolase [Sporosarcina sp. Te-1]